MEHVKKYVKAKEIYTIFEKYPPADNVAVGFTMHRLLGTVYRFSQEFVADEVGEGKEEPGDRCAAGQCVDQLKNSKQNQRQTRSNTWPCRQRQQNTGYASDHMHYIIHIYKCLM